MPETIYANPSIQRAYLDLKEKHNQNLPGLYTVLEIPDVGFSTFGPGNTYLNCRASGDWIWLRCYGIEHGLPKGGESVGVSPEQADSILAAAAKLHQGASHYTDYTEGTLQLRNLSRDLTRGEIPESFDQLSERWSQDYEYGRRYAHGGMEKGFLCGMPGLHGKQDNAMIVVQLDESPEAFKEQKHGKRVEISACKSGDRAHSGKILRASLEEADAVLYAAQQRFGSEEKVIDQMVKDSGDEPCTYARIHCLTNWMREEIENIRECVPEWSARSGTLGAQA